MRVMIFVKATKDSEAGLKPSDEMAKMFEDMGRFNQQLIDAGIMKEGDGLKPTSHAKRVKFDGADRTVIDGPFTKDVNELVAGYWIWEVKDMNEAIAWVKKCPNPMMGPSEIEIRPFYEMADFEGVLTPEAEKIHAENLRKSSN
jgi:hypothetical protein